MDAVTAILDDHRLLEDLFDRLAGAKSRDRERLFAELKVRFGVHTTAEESLVYPALLVHHDGEGSEVHHGIREHRLAEAKLAEIDAADADEFIAALRDFTASARHHIAEEEGEILPALRAAIPPDRLRELGQDFETRRVSVLNRAGLDWSVCAR
ncbi:hemerythrin domain-containing protein [Phytomonospora sp. NPDC050363]|uniref:hemerythrin domain-containing protein n=1 Tax=Phytomonospora sp. NPDC050363 TaxID=3155642 RepID=UPI0033E9837B